MSSFSQKKESSEREYLIALKTEYKLLKKKYQQTAEDLETWESRIVLAEKKNRNDLKDEAEKQAEIIRGQSEGLRTELVSLMIEIEKAESSYKSEKNKPDLSVNPSELLADIKNLTGDTSERELENSIKKSEVELELEKLKKEMKEN